jgi:hypothetical protein
LHNICYALRIKLNRLVDYDFAASFPFELEDIGEMHLRCKIYRDKSSALEALLAKARVHDENGSRSKWHYDGSEERETASQHFRKACEVAQTIYGTGSERLAEVEKETAEHFESRHSEHGRPEYSKWNP